MNGLGSLAAVVVLTSACLDDSNVVSSAANETGGQAGSGSSGAGGTVSGTGGALTGGNGGSANGGSGSTGGDAAGGDNPGGSSSTGGAAGSGGAPTGGTLGDGGRPSGGTAGGGGTTGTGGTAGDGGTAGSGGAAGEAGAPGTGGLTGDGGQGGSAGSVSDAEKHCLDLGGTVQTATCCQGTGDFPNLCLDGPCGCAPENSHEIKFCLCPENRCFDGQYCLRQDPGDVYLLWQAPAGTAGAGSALELLEDGTLRLWERTTALDPHDTADWDYEFSLGYSEQLALVNLLSDIDYDSLPHPSTGGECYPSYYFESTLQPSVTLTYGNASGLSPEFDSVYLWLDAFITSHAPDYPSTLPSSYCQL